MNDKLNKSSIYLYITSFSILLTVILSITVYKPYNIINIFNISLISLAFYISSILIITYLVYFLLDKQLPIKFTKAYELTNIVPIFILLLIITTSFIIFPTRVSGISMDDTLEDNEIIFVNVFSKKYVYKDIVVLDINSSTYNVDESELYVKRIIGLPGDTVEYIDGLLYLNNQLTEEDYATINTYSNFNIDTICPIDNCNNTIPEGYILAMGDNRFYSQDSEELGLIRIKDVVGKVI